MKSGSNQFHGSGYDYYVNEFLNAGTPFTNDGNRHLLRPRQRRNDYSFSVGGPVWIPKVYNGHDKTFFYINWEQFRETTRFNNLALTMPILQAIRDGFDDLGAQRSYLQVWRRSHYQYASNSRISSIGPD
jgi:hypothetical protein